MSRTTAENIEIRKKIYSELSKKEHSRFDCIRLVGKVSNVKVKTNAKKEDCIRIILNEKILNDPDKLSIIGEFLQIDLPKIESLTALGRIRKWRKEALIFFVLSSALTFYIFQQSPSTEDIKQQSNLIIQQLGDTREAIIDTFITHTQPTKDSFDLDELNDKEKEVIDQLAAFESGGNYQAITNLNFKIEIFDDERNQSAFYVSIGNGHFGLKQYDKAIEYYDLAIEAYKENYNAWLNKGKALIKLKKFDEAIMAFKIAEMLHNFSFSLSFNKGAAYYYRGLTKNTNGTFSIVKKNVADFDSAIVAFNQAVDIDKAMRYQICFVKSSCYYNKWRQLMYVGQHKLSSKHKEELKSLKEEALLEGYKTSSKFLQLETFKKPKNSYYLLMVLKTARHFYEETGRIDSAGILMETGLKLFPNNSEMLGVAGDFYIYYDRDKGVQLLETALKINIKNSSAASRLNTHYLNRNGSSSKKLTWDILNSYRNMDSKAASYAILAYSHFTKLECDSSVKYYELALKNDFPPINNYFLAKCHIDLNRLSEAESTLKKMSMIDSVAQHQLYRQVRKELDSLLTTR